VLNSPLFPKERQTPCPFPLPINSCRCASPDKGAFFLRSRRLGNVGVRLERLWKFFASCDPVAPSPHIPVHLCSAEVPQSNFLPLAAAALASHKPLSCDGGFLWTPADPIFLTPARALPPYCGSLPNNDNFLWVVRCVTSVVQTLPLAF